MNWPRTRLVRAGALIGLGLAVEAATFFFGGPLPFLIFAMVGCLLVGVGVLDYLFYVLSSQARP